MHSSGFSGTDCVCSWHGNTMSNQVLRNELLENRDNCWRQGAGCQWLGQTKQKLGTEQVVHVDDLIIRYLSSMGWGFPLR